jgi:hypothetical protein
MPAVQHTIAGTVLTMPVRVRKADVHTAMFSVPADAAQRLIDYSGLTVCQFRPGRAVVTLCGPDMGYLTGTTIPLDGGQANFD